MTSWLRKCWDSFRRPRRSLSLFPRRGFSWPVKATATVEQRSNISTCLNVHPDQAVTGIVDVWCTLRALVHVRARVLMSRLLFDGRTHQLSLIGDSGVIVGTWPAYNNVDSHATLTHLQNRTYAVQDQAAPRRHVANANGPYGLHGIVRFNVPGHSGIGVHSGRADARHLPGPAHPTMGCIRTTDEAMRTISASMATARLITIEVANNSAPLARAATRRNRHRPLAGRHHV